MKKAFKKLLTVVVAIATSASLAMPAYAGKGGMGGMSRGSSGGGMSARSMGGMSSRSMGSSSFGSSARSMGSSMSNMSRSMGSSNFGSRNGSFSSQNLGGVSRNLGSFGNGGNSGSFNNAARNLSNNVNSRATVPSKGLGSLKGNVAGKLNRGGLDNRVTTRASDLVKGVNGKTLGGKLGTNLGKKLDGGIVKDLGRGKLGDLGGRMTNDLGRGKLGDLTKGRLGNRASDLLGGKFGSRVADGLKTGGLKTGRIPTGGLSKIDRSKLRDMVKGIGAGKGKGKLGGGVLAGLDKKKIGDLFGGGKVKPFKPGDVLGNGKGFGPKGAKGFFAGEHFHKHKDHWHGHGHNHWFDFCFGGGGFDFCYDPCYDHCYDYCYDYCYYPTYDYCYYPAYYYPTCDVTFGYSDVAMPPPADLVMAAAPPVVIDQEITIDAAKDETVTNEATDSADEATEPGKSEPAATEPTTEEANVKVSTPLDPMLDKIVAEIKAEQAASKDAVIDEPKADEPKADEVKADKAVAGEAVTEDAKTDEASTAAPVIRDAATDATTVEPAVQPDLDLELIDVEMVNVGDRDAKVGPRFKVTVRNAGKQDVEKFLVSLVACKETQLDSSSLHASETVAALAAGKEAVVEVTLPVESLSLNQASDGKATPFNSLVAAVDSDERVNEGNEDNNLSLIDRTSIRLANN